MSISFVDFAAETQDRIDTTDSILKYTHCLCEALKYNYIESSIKKHKRYIERNDNVEYHIQCIDDLHADKLTVNFMVESGRKYHKIVFINFTGNKSAHAFVNQKTGEIHKSKNWSSPEKDSRYNLLDYDQREWLYQNADYSGGYLSK